MDGKKVIIGDNLSSHLSVNVLKLCEQENISFVLLPPNSTHLCQPLDVSFFGPMKRHWRRILEAYKMKNPKTSSFDKSKFPHLLKQLLEDSGMKSQDNMKAGFKACGICPFNPNQVLHKLPDTNKLHNDSVQELISGTLLDYLQAYRFGDAANDKENNLKPPRKKLVVVFGKSVSAEEVASYNKKSVSQKVVDKPSDSESESDIQSDNDDHDENAYKSKSCEPDIIAVNSILLFSLLYYSSNFCSHYFS